MATATTTRRSKKQAEVVTDTAASKVLSPEQVAELEQTKTDSKATEGETVEYHPLEGETIQVPVVRRLTTAIEIRKPGPDGTDRTERYHWVPGKPVAEVMFDRVVEAKAENAATPATGTKVKKSDLGSALTRCRAELSQSWKDIDGGDPVAYVASLQRAITRAYQAQDMARVMIEQTAKK